MIPEQQLVRKILDALAGEPLQRTPVLEEYAEQYAELCRDVAARLQRCAEYLDRGMRSEAVHEATSPPSLLALVDVVCFPELRKWANAVADLQLAPFPQIPQQIVERLRRECAIEERLSPLLKEYRRCVYQGDRPGSIRVLRRLRAEDPENPVWPRNLRPLEEAEDAVLARQAEEALAAQDLGRLRELLEDLTHPQRAAPPPAELTARLRDALLAERRVALRLEAAALARRARAAVAAADRAEVAACLAEWDRLRGEDVFRPEPDAEAALAEAHAAAEVWERERLAEEEFRAVLEETHRLLQSPRASSRQIEAKLARLRALEAHVSDALRAEARRAGARAAARKQHRRRAAWVSAAVLCCAVAVAAAAGVWRIRLAGVRERQFAALTASLEARDYGRLRAELDALRERDPAFFGREEVRRLVERCEEGLRLREQAGRRYRAVMDQLAQIRNDGYTAPDDRVLALLAEAHQTAPDASADQEVGAWQSEWETRRRRLQAEAEDALARVTGTLRRVLDGQRLRPFPTLADEEGALAALEPAVRDAGPYASRASPEAAAAFQAACAELEAWRRRVDQARATERQRQERLQALRAGIDRALPDLAQYKTLLAKFLEEFPEAPEAVAFRKALSQCDAWAGVEALRTFEPPRLPLGPEAARRLREQLAAEGVRGSVWEPDLRALLTWLERNEAAREAIPSLTVTPDDSLRIQMTRYRPVGSQDWKVLYHPKPLMSRKETDAQGEYQVFWGLVYAAESDDQAPVLVHTSKAFPDGFTSRRYEVRPAARMQDSFVPHGVFLYRFAAEASDAPELDVHLLKGIQSALEEPGMDPVPRAWVLKRLAALLAEYFADTVPESAALAEALQGLDTDAPWMNPRHPRVTAASRQIQQALRGFPAMTPIAARIQADRALLAVSLGRKVTCAGRVARGRDGTLEAAFLAEGEGPVWVLAAPGRGSAAWGFLVAGTRDAAGTLALAPDLERELFEGQVLFAPADGRTTREVFEAAVPAEARERVRRPASWPANDWPGL